MLKTIELDNAITHLFRGEELSTLGMEIMSELDLERLIQSVRHHAEPVYAYRADTCEDSGCNYRGELLFPCPATLLYSMPYVKADSDSGVSFTRRRRIRQSAEKTPGSFPDQTSYSRCDACIFPQMLPFSLIQWYNSAIEKIRPKRESEGLHGRKKNHR